MRIKTAFQTQHRLLIVRQVECLFPGFILAMMQILDEHGSTFSTELIRCDGVTFDAETSSHP